MVRLCTPSKHMSCLGKVLTHVNPSFWPDCPAVSPQEGEVESIGAWIANICVTEAAYGHDAPSPIVYTANRTQLT